MSINPSDDFDKISKVFKSFEDARKSFFKKNSSLDEALLSKLQGLVDKHILSPSGNSAVTEILDDLNSLKGKKLKDLTQDQDLVQIALSLTGQQKNLKPKSDFEVFKQLLDNFVQITSDKENNSKTLKQSFFPLLDGAGKLLKSLDAKKVLNLIKRQLTAYGESEIKDLNPGSPSFEIIAEILKEHLVILEDEGFVSLKSEDDVKVDLSSLKWDTKEEREKSHKIFRSTLLSCFEDGVTKAEKVGYLGEDGSMTITPIDPRSIQISF